ncbi:MAG: type III pantothenate kinase [Gammaproteobacteria bacterium]
MKLLVDVGNTRVKWAFVGPDSLVARGEAFRAAPGDLQPLLEAPYQVTEIRLANVAGAQAGADVVALLLERFRLTPRVALSAASGAGVRNGYGNPAQLGVDRWLGICAAYARYPGPVCVVDAGTATTVDFVTGSGEHRGGLILAGIELMRSALLHRTGDLSRLSATGPSVPDKLAGSQDASAGSEGRLMFGRDTAAAIHLGALQATASLICLSAAAFQASLPPAGPGLTLVVTGGSAPVLQSVIGGLATFTGRPAGSPLQCHPDLVLEGLALEPPCFADA